MEYVGLWLLLGFFKMVNSYRQKILAAQVLGGSPYSACYFTFFPAEVKLTDWSVRPLFSHCPALETWLRASVTLDTALFVFGIHRVTLPLT